jgi:XTP/dITP diphosphohydrolase
VSIGLVAASANPDKVAEIAEILRDAGVRLQPRPKAAPDVEETGGTLLDNARLKARAVAAAAGAPAVADDTGLEVDALGGAPGVRSARYAGEGVTYADNVAKLLAALAALPDGGAERHARFRTVAVVSFPAADGRAERELWREGTVEGRIARAPSGEGGFGYDAVFVPDDGDGRTFAEMSTAEKHALSHRGRAFRALADALRDLEGAGSRGTGDAARNAW